MINREAALEKSISKTAKQFGLSVIFDVSEYSKTNNSLNALQSLPFRDCFVWTDISNYHLTILRCKSISCDFNIANEVLLFLSRIFEKRGPFCIKSTSLNLDTDGVIRLHFSEISTAFLSGIDVPYIIENTGFEYRLIMKPWITLAYCNPESIDKIIDNNIRIDNYLNSLFINFKFPIDKLSIVKYYDTGFQHKQFMTTIMLGVTL